MVQMGGKAIFLDATDAPIGAGKESIADTARTISRYADVLMARLYAHEDLLELAEFAGIPVINGLTNERHPCQALADMMTIRTQRGELKGQRFTYVGDANNNVTHSLLEVCSKLGVHMTVCCPPYTDFSPAPTILEQAHQNASVSGARVSVSADPVASVTDADIVYTDTWMSYHIPAQEQVRRRQVLLPYQVTSALMKHARPDALFMHCLPAQRGQEQSAEVLDGPQSIVFEQAENRLHLQKAILLALFAG